MKTRNLAALTVLGLLLAGCSATNPLDRDPSGVADQVVVGSQAYYSNEIIAEIYAQALENAGYTVTRQFSIGQRDAYMPSIESGAISLFPEYTGNLLQFYEPETTARESSEVYQALSNALPDGLAVLEQADATDQDSVTVTQEFATEHQVESIADLTEIDTLLKLGGPVELAGRPYGPTGLKEIYGLEVEFIATGDTTVEDLQAGTVDIANVPTADPRIQTLGLMPLADPQGLFLASHVVPLVTAELAKELAPIVDPISRVLSPEALVELNVSSQVNQESAAVIAQRWLSDNGLLG